MSYLPHHADRIRMPQDGQPEGIFTWVRLPDGRIRLYASRDLPDVGWGQRDRLDRGVVWHLDADMANLLIVDRPTAAEALTFVLEKWAREDGQAEAAEQARLERAAKVSGLAAADRRQIGR